MCSGTFKMGRRGLTKINHKTSTLFYLHFWSASVAVADMGRADGLAIIQRDFLKSSDYSPRGLAELLEPGFFNNLEAI